MGAKSYLWKGFLIYEEMRKYFPIYEEAASHMSLQLLHSEFPYIRGNLIFFFVSVGNGGGGKFKNEKETFMRSEQKYQQVALEVERNHMKISESLSIAKSRGGITK
jgi:hypothetical protein